MIRQIVTLLAGALIAGPVPALTTSGNTITLTDEEVRHCATGGGCIVMPRAALDAALEIVKSHAAAQCGSRT